MPDIRARQLAAMRAEVRAGLSAPQKELPSKYFYDAAGSALFQRITELQEYYPTRTEYALLEQIAVGLVEKVRPCTLLELGPGGGRKSRVLLDAMRTEGPSPVYVPVDVSRTYLDAIAAEMLADGAARVLPVVADISAEIPVPQDVPAPVLHAFLGSTIGNFDGEEAVELLRRVRRAMRPEDFFLLGVDLQKDVRDLEAAYNDAEGVTAEFNRNLLVALNRELGANFDPAAWEHRAFYDPVQKRIEMHLVAHAAQAIEIPDVGAFTVTAGESIRTEISCKYDRHQVEAMFHAARLELRSWYADGDRFALALAVRKTAAT